MDRQRFFFNEREGWGYSSMGLTKRVNKPPLPFIIKDTCNLSIAAAVLLETARVAPISLKYYGFCFSNGTYRVRLYFAEISSNQNVYPSRPTPVFDIDIQGKNAQKNYNIETAAVNEDGDKIVDHITSIKSHLEIHLYWSGNGSVHISAINVTKELRTTELFPGGVYTFIQIKDSTQNFNAENKLGEGGFGPVYKGVLPDGTTIAVKQLSGKSKQGIREFVNEIGTISALDVANDI